MKKSTKICTLLLIVVLVLSSLLMTACDKKQYKQLKEDIDKVATVRDDQHKYEYELSDMDLSIYYFEDSDWITLNVSSYDSSSSLGLISFYMDIDNKCSGEYSVSFHLSGTKSMMRATLSAKESTGKSVFIYDRKYENVSATIRTSFDNLAEIYAKICLNGFGLFLSTHSDLTPADFGFENL